MQETLLASHAAKLLIDHHIGPREDHFDLVFSQMEISSTCELLFYILLATSQAGGDASKLPMPVLRALMTGMTTDTNNFANSVFPSTFEMASRMLEAGVDRDGILAELYDRCRENRLRMTGHLLKDNMRILPNGVSCIVVRRSELEEYDIREGETEGIVNMPLVLDTVRMSIFLREDDGFFRVSIRSKRGTSAFRLATTVFHGGGHEQAAGGRLYFPGDIADDSMAEAYLERITDDYFKTGNEN
jgi:phosphoesterase RecJ-like protein